MLLNGSTLSTSSAVMSPASMSDLKPPSLIKAICCGGFIVTLINGYANYTSALSQAANIESVTKLPKLLSLLSFLAR